MKIVVVGASGTGSLMNELLLRAGCKQVMGVDDDISEEVNGNRVLHLTNRDVENRIAKVKVAHRAVQQSGFDCTFIPVIGNVLEQRTLLKLRDADVIIGCIDKGFPRKILCQFAYQYLRPYIDIGSEIGGDQDGIVSVNSRANLIVTGRYCLCCTGLVTSRQIGFESKTFEERQRIVGEGYSDDLIIKQPAVMDLNMRAAGLGMMLLRHILQPFLRMPIPVTISENLVTYTMLPIMEARAANPRCRLCKQNPVEAFGDCGPQIGLDERAFRAIRGPVHG